MNHHLILRISQIKLPIRHSKEQLLGKALKMCGLPQEAVVDWKIRKQSIDARKKDRICYLYVVDLYLAEKYTRNRKFREGVLVTDTVYAPAPTGAKALPESPVIIGSGPAGLFCAYLLALNGYAPRIFERGASMEQRVRETERFFREGTVDPDTNVQFGEGGAGTFSDGKLNTGVKDKTGRKSFVLETFVRFGAQEDILYSAKPHIGTDILSQVIVSLRQEIIRLGGSFSFESQITGFNFNEDSLQGLYSGDEKIDCSVAVLATGHSARDTFCTLKQAGVAMEAKSFAVGYRVEHPQAMINRSQYGNGPDVDLLPSSPYKVTAHSSNGRGVYSFCMCPGGYVVNASSEPGRLAVNGMSCRARDSHNANSAVIMTIGPADYGTEDVLDGMRFQQKLEEQAFVLGQGRIPQQLFQDFKNNRPSDSYGEFDSVTKGSATLTNLRGLLPESLEEAFVEGMESFGRKLKGFDRPDAILSGVESRTSSPVRILRDENLESNMRGLYPCGEGAGYAGGIMSAAMDGLKVAEEIMKRYHPQ